MFQSILLCVQPNGTTNAETFHSGIWAPPTATENTRAHTHLLRSALSPHLKKHGRRFWRRQASNPCRTQDGRCILCRLHSVSSIVSAVAPREKPTSTSTSATICIKTNFTIVCKVVAHRRQTTMASRLNIEKECLQSMRGVRVHCFRRQMS